MWKKVVLGWNPCVFASSRCATKNRCNYVDMFVVQIWRSVSLLSPLWSKIHWFLGAMFHFWSDSFFSACRYCIWWLWCACVFVCVQAILQVPKLWRLVLPATKGSQPEAASAAHGCPQQLCEFCSLLLLPLVATTIIIVIILPCFCVFLYLWLLGRFSPKSWRGIFNVCNIGVHAVHTKARQTPSLYKCWLGKTEKQLFTPSHPGLETWPLDLQSRALTNQPWIPVFHM